MCVLFSTDSYSDFIRLFNVPTYPRPVYRIRYETDDRAAAATTSVWRKLNRNIVLQSEHRGVKGAGTNSAPPVRGGSDV